MRAILKHYSTPALILALVATGFLSSCCHFEPSHKGVVINIATGEPVPNTLVLEELYYMCLLPPAPAGKDSHTFGHVEAVSGLNGQYTLPFGFYLLPPLLCLVNSKFMFQHPAYDTFEYGQGLPWEDPAPSYVTAKLRKRTCELQFRRDRDLTFRKKVAVFEPSENEEKLFSAVQALRLVPVDEPGVFVRLKGRKIDRIQELPANLGSGGIYAHDAISDEWLLLDVSGNEEPKNKFWLPDSPGWEYPGSNKLGSMGIFASSSRVFFWHPLDSDREKLKLVITNAAKGNITALVGDAGRFYTFEDNGTKLCTYRGMYPQRPIFISAVTVRDVMPNISDVNSARFTHLINTYNRFCTIIKDDNGWHFYSSNDGVKFKELLTLPVTKIVTAVTVNEGKYNVAIKGEGINFFYENNDKLERVQSVLTEKTKSVCDNISGLAGGEIYVDSVIYFSCNDDRIFRFATDGTPDRRIEIDPDSISPSWYRR